jgi:membrane-associated protease RseP (regulator of RpoE activity)
VTPGSAAEQAGLQPGDVIVGINREPVRSDRDVISMVRSMQPGERISIAFERVLQTEAVLGGQADEQIHTAAYPPDERGTQQTTVAPQNDQRMNVDRRDGNNQPQRGILNRNRDNSSNRPLRRGLLN